MRTWCSRWRGWLGNLRREDQKVRNGSPWWLPVARVRRSSVEHGAPTPERTGRGLEPGVGIGHAFQIVFGPENAKRWSLKKNEMNVSARSAARWTSWAISKRSRTSHAKGCSQRGPPNKAACTVRRYRADREARR